MDQQLKTVMLVWLSAYMAGAQKAHHNATGEVISAEALEAMKEDATDSFIRFNDFLEQNAEQIEKVICQPPVVAEGQTQRT